MPGRILVVDDVPANVRLLEAKLINEFYEVVTAQDGETALTIAKTEAPDIILLDVMMPGMDGFEVTRQLKANPDTRQIPVVLVTALSDTKDRVEGLQAGADDFLTKPVQDVSLFARVRSLMRLRMMIEEWRARDRTAKHFGVIQSHEVEDDGRKGLLLLIEHNPIDAANVVEALAEDEHEILGAINPDEGFVLAQQRWFDLIMISTSNNEDATLRLCSKMRAQEKTRHTPILLLADHDDKQRLAQALDLGVNDFIITPADKDELLARTRIQVRRSRYQQLLRSNFEASLTMALTDTLTGLYNRRYFESHVQQLIDKAHKTDKPLCMLAIDIDYFKKINDTHGHASGDVVLKEISKRLSYNVRSMDLVARLGGEEFVIVMPETDGKIGLIIAERLRQSIASEKLPINNTDSIDVTISIGLSSIEAGGEKISGDELLKRADEALYRAKGEGRNKVITDKKAALG